MPDDNIENLEKELDLSGYSKSLVLEIITPFLIIDQFWFNNPNKNILYYRNVFKFGKWWKIFIVASILSLIAIIYLFKYYSLNKTVFLIFLVLFLLEPFILYLYVLCEKRRFPISGFISLSESNSMILTLNTDKKPKKLGNDFKIEISNVGKFNELQKVHEDHIDKFLKSEKDSALYEITLEHVRKSSMRIINSLFYSPKDYNMREIYPNEGFNYKENDRSEIQDNDKKKRPILIKILAIYYVILGAEGIFEQGFLGSFHDFLSSLLSSFLFIVVGLGIYKQKKWAGIFALFTHSILFIILIVGLLLILLIYFGYITTPSDYKLGVAPLDYKSVVIGFMTFIPMVIIISNWKVFK